MGKNITIEVSFTNYLSKWVCSEIIYFMGLFFLLQNTFLLVAFIVIVTRDITELDGRGCGTGLEVLLTQVQPDALVCQTRLKASSVRHSLPRFPNWYLKNDNIIINNSIII